ncbi:MAG: DUF6494 family protein [Pseudomonadota bacterium]
MDEEALNLSIRKFLKQVGVLSQREIERAVRRALEAGAVRGDEHLPAIMTLELPGLGLRTQFEGTIMLERRDGAATDE